MNPCYNGEMNIQITVALLKAHGIRKVVASPGGTNIGFVWSVQHDPFFELFSAVDERHASYLACGIAAELKEPVVLSCTGATASRNYMSALTEAYYRKLPILAVTSSQPISHLGNMWPQVTDRRNPAADCVKYSVQLPLPRTKDDFHDCELKVNKAILELMRHGGGPVHINLETEYAQDYRATELPEVIKLARTMPYDEQWPEIPKDKKIAVWVGAHLKFSERETKALELFVKANNAVVLTDRTSGYQGFGQISSSLLCVQELGSNPALKHLKPELVIHIGEISGDYYTMSTVLRTESWRVNEDGEARDLLGCLTNVFEMPEWLFFEHYSNGSSDCSYYKAWAQADAELRQNLPEIPFSNIWIARELSNRLPKGSRIHLGILNSLRSWNYFPPTEDSGFCNTGGFGIDGCVSSMIGASIVCPDKLFFGFFGDLAFFYDLNSIGNRHCGSNLRILVVNNGVGGEFSLYTNVGSGLGKDQRKFIGAEQHFGDKSRDLLRHFATDLGFDYLCAANKEEFDSVKDKFLTPKSDRSIVFECFTNIEDDVKAQYEFDHFFRNDPPPSMRNRIGAILPVRLKSVIKRVI